MLSLRPVCGQDEPFLRDLIVSHIAAEPGFSILPEPVRTEISVLQHKARRGSIAATYPDAAEQIIIVDGQSAGWLVVAKLAAEVRLVEILISDAYRSKRCWKQCDSRRDRIRRCAWKASASHRVPHQPARNPAL